MTFEVQVKPAIDFPIDLYLLMDLSASMSDDLTNLKSLGTQLGERYIYDRACTGRDCYLHYYFHWITWVSDVFVIEHIDNVFKRPI